MPDINKALQIFSREGEEHAEKNKAQKLGIPYVNLVGYPFTPDVLSIIPKDQANQLGIISFYRLNNQVKVATPYPENKAIIPFLKEIAGATNLQFYLYLCSESSLRYGLTQLEFVREKPKTLEKHVISQEFLNKNLGEAESLKSIGTKILNCQTTEVMDMLFAGAIHLDASDIHIEPVEDGARVRYRIDGILQDIVVLPEEVYKAIRNRIKYLSRLKLNITEEAQDGRFDVQIGTQDIDIRVSLIPGAWGEVIVTRLLNPSGAAITLEELGFRKDALVAIQDAISRPNGAIFNTGPTGSGKTTTLYAILQKLNKPEVKIITLEDPIEYKIAGIDQSQINAQKGYDFLSGLKHVLRQDPDVIMVGEIRDKETAETALQAALTGHLVLTTLHTNSAPSTIPRLLDMDVRPFLLSGSITLIIAQRLVRKVCKICGGRGSSGASTGVLQSTPNVTRMNNPSGISRAAEDRQGPAMATCLNCKGTGYKGRIAIVEMMKITPKIEQLIASKGTILDFERVAREDGMIPMRNDGMEKVRLGLTTQEEVERVTVK